MVREQKIEILLGAGAIVAFVILMKKYPVETKEGLAIRMGYRVLFALVDVVKHLDHE